jgi:hypothetical protein
MPIVRRTTAGHWQDWVNLVLGAWLFISPWALGYAGLRAPAWNSWIFGAVVALLSIAALVQFAPWEEWVNFVIGVWLLISPWVLGYAQSSRAALWDAVIVGLIVGGLALWDALESRQTTGLAA